MKTTDLKARLLGKTSRPLQDHNSYLEMVHRFINDADLATEYEDEVHFLEDLFHSDNKSFFTISSKENFNDFVTDGYAQLSFIYTPLNDHSRVHMHRGDLVFCYRQGQFGSLDEALRLRGIYGLGIVASEPQVLFPDKQNHEKYGVLVILPFAFDHHLELREIQLNPSTINLTPYNGNRNDALQYIESSIHIQTLLEMIARCNPNKRREIELVSDRILKEHKLPSEIWGTHDGRILQNSNCQQIFFGAPGTGKSHKIDNDLFKDANGNSLGIGLKNVPQEQKFRTTFHPDYDYAQFVGSYKPKKRASGQITYDFVPQVFAKAYVAAWKAYLENQSDPKQIYLVIEEINRGNCAQIFGDIFQLLDRKDGNSEYPIDIDSDFADFIRTELNDKFDSYKREICSYCDDAAQEESVANEEFCKIALPPNFNILATMNTSDQSLFPMDSAFKRRFNWKYVPINYNHEKADFTIEIGNDNYSWLDFLKKVNKNICETTLCEDKQMGEFFVKLTDDKKTIDLDMFRSKVLFYLWDSVYKEETSQNKIFHFPKENDPEDKVSFQTFFEGSKDDQIKLVQKIFEHLGVSSNQPQAPNNEGGTLAAENAEAPAEPEETPEA